MTTHPRRREDAPYWSLPGLAEGAWRAAPLLPGTIIFGTAFGTIAAQKGLTLSDTVLMNALVCAGAAQLVGLEVWTNPLALGTIVSIAASPPIVNARFILMGASLRPWLGPLPAWQVYPMLLLTTDATWIVGMRYRAEGGNDASVYLGGGLAIWASWVAAAVPGYLLGAVITDPKRFGFDLMLPIFFAAMLVPLWRGARRAIGWVIAGAVALVVAWLVPGWWFIVVGALAGSIAGGFIDERDDPPTYGPPAGILAMAVATYLTRVSGFWLMGHVPLTARLRRMLEALPGAVVAATVLPIVMKTGMPAASRHRRRAFASDDRCAAMNSSRSRSASAAASLRVRRAVTGSSARGGMVPPGRHDDGHQEPASRSPSRRSRATPRRSRRCRRASRRRCRPDRTP